MFNELSSSPTVANCTFSGNSAAHYGGGMYNAGSSPTVTNCTFSGNSASHDGGGMFNHAGSSPDVTNCIFWGIALTRYPTVLASQRSPTATSRAAVPQTQPVHR